MELNSQNSKNEYTSNKQDISTIAIEKVKIMDILDLAKQLGELRYKFIELIEEERKNIKSYEHNDCTLVHAFEFEELSKDEVWKRYLTNKESRTQRRMSKYRYAILKAILDNITIKKASKFVVEAIHGGKNTKDFETYIEELQEDPTLFVKE